MKSPPKIALTENEELQLFMISVLNFTCGYYGRYSSDADAPIMYEQYIDTGRFGVQLLKNATINAKFLPKNKNDALDALEGKLADGLRKDLDSGSFNEEEIRDKTDMLPIEILLKAVSQSDNFPRQNFPTDCDDVSAMTRRVFDKYVSYE